MSNIDTKLLNPITLAFGGDAVYELLVRRKIIEEYGSLPANKLHKLTVEMVKASAQANAFIMMEPHLTEQELAIYKRGRNSTSVSVPKSASTAQYRSATGVEALFGWLYFNDCFERITELFNFAGEVFDEQRKSTPAETGNKILL